METSTDLRELAHRISGGQEISLVWDAREDCVSVLVRDVETGVEFQVPADREKALDAFNHPFAYANFLDEAA